MFLLIIWINWLSLQESSSSNDEESDQDQDEIELSSEVIKKNKKTLKKLGKKVIKKRDADLRSDDEKDPSTPKSKSEKAKKVDKKTPSFGSVKIAGGRNKKRFVRQFEFK